MRYGLLESDLQHIVDAAKSFPEIKTLLLFGSRAKGNYKKASDVDLALQGEQVSYDTVAQLSSVLNEEKPLPYFFDTINYQTLSNPQLKEHIDRVGIVLYEKD